MSTNVWDWEGTPNYQDGYDTRGFVSETISRWDRFRPYVLAATVALLAVTLVSSVLWETRSIASGDNLSVQERANVMLTTHVANDLFSLEDLSWIERYVASSAIIETPLGASYGREGLQQFGDVVTSLSAANGYQLSYVEASGNQVEFDWRVGGFLAEGDFGASSQAGLASSSGRLLATVVDGQIVEMRIIPTQ